MGIRIYLMFNILMLQLRTEFTRRLGTSDLGREYEFKILALLSLRCINKGIEDFWLLFNAEGVGNFDDVILHIEGKTFLMQLKHQENPKVISQGEFLNARYKEFTLKKYLKDILKLKNDLNSLQTTNTETSILTKMGNFDDIYFILYTNRFVNETCSFLIEDVNNQQLSRLNTASNYKIFKFDPKELCDKLQLNDLDYIKNFYLFPNQLHAIDVDKEIKEEIERLISTDVQSISEDFVKFITEWCKGNLGGNYCLTKNDVISYLTDLQFSQYEIELVHEPYSYYENGIKSIWNEIVNDKSITIVDVNFDDKVIVPFLLEYIGSEVQNYCNVTEIKNWSTNIPKKHKSSFYKNNNDCKLQMLKLIGERGKINLYDVYKCLWSLHKFPLLLEIDRMEEYKEISKMLKLSNYLYKVIILNKTGKSLITNTPNEYFYSLNDLSIKQRESILEQPIKLQGRPGAKLKNLIDDTMLLNIKTADIIHILLNNFNVGKELNEIPGYYIERVFTKILIKYEALTTSKNEIFLIDDCKNIFETVAMEQNLNFILLSEINFENLNLHSIIVNRYPEKQTFDILLSSEKPVHHLVLYNANYLEWKQSYGSITNIRNSRLELDTILESVIPVPSTNQMHIISANPGMGKSMLLDHIAQKTPTDKWVLRIDLNKHLDYYGTLECENKNMQYREHINRFRTSENELTDRIFEKLFENKDIVILLDGFDDISLTHKEEVTSIIKSFIKNGFYVWLTTRPMMKPYLEEIFNAFAFTLIPFTEETQKLFLEKYFNEGNKFSNLEELLKEFTEKLLTAFKKNIADLKAEFTGTPLHVKLLAECFTDDCEKFLISEGKVEFNETFDLLDLFDKFIQRKIKILCDRYGPGSKDLHVIYKDYQSICALKVLFPLHKHIIDDYFDDYKEYTVQHIQVLQKEGILITDENCNISFVHRTFAEYLAAKWLSVNLNNKNPNIKNIIKILIAQRFQVKSSVVEDYKYTLFDRFLSRDFVLHLSIINGKLNEDEFSNLNVTATDKAGRSVLHLIALYVRQHPSLLNCSLLINKLLKENIGIRTDLLGYNPLDYALINNSIDMANLICEKWTNSKINIYIDSRLQVKYLNNSMFTNYKSLFRAIFPYFAYRNILLKNISIYETVHSYLIHFLPLACPHEYGEMKISDLPNIELYINRNNLYYRIMLGDKDSIRKLLKDNKNINERNNEGKTLLHYAVLQDEFEIINLLLLNGADVNTRKLATSIPIYDNNFDLALRRNITLLNDTNDGGNTPLHYAILKGKLQIIDLLLSKGASVNTRNYKSETSLHYGAKYGNLEIVDKLIYYKADINAINKKGNTPLHIAILKQKFDIVYSLLSKGADANLKNLNNSTPLHCCANKGDNKLLSTLMSLKVDINAQNIKGDTPLHIAILKGRSELIFLLLVRGANANIKNLCGNTPLHLSVQNDDVDSIIKLISYNAKVDIQNTSGYTPLDLAASNNRSDIIDLLLSNQS
ncbi:hypothetical protein ILUMI_13011 [Ignelater luminosus]|uniref:NACHT domain-containing protein n=1 Tax=Ignelater luminosus TaxID=2038154 RepID=A0A8K0G684_IGNLU|nr:hypothetical protein ILUMI_13011 [Ignelater luminosus]